jgi:glycosyltransferase involved in cell wall biosynthesis
MIDLNLGFFDSNNPKILHIGTKNNKNLENTIIALQGINCEFWIVGKLNASQCAYLGESLIKFRNFVDLSNSEILQLYCQCDIVSFLSVYEGFGMPIIEAQAYGKPVLTSSLYPMIEVAGSGALFVDPFNILEIRSGFRKIIDNKNLRDQIIGKGFFNQRRFEINEIVMNYKSVYEGI